MRKFEVEIIGSVTIELDEKVIDAVDDNWRSSIYNLKTPEEIAAHIAYNFVVNGATLSRLDGWADQTDDLARITDEDLEFKACERKVAEREF